MTRMAEKLGHKWDLIGQLGTCLVFVDESMTLVLVGILSINR
jgi:hypothetical protein